MFVFFSLRVLPFLKHSLSVNETETEDHSLDRKAADTCSLDYCCLVTKNIKKTRVILGRGWNKNNHCFRNLTKITYRNDRVMSASHNMMALHSVFLDCFCEVKLYGLYFWGTTETISRTLIPLMIQPEVLLINILVKWHDHII